MVTLVAKVASSLTVTGTECLAGLLYLFIAIMKWLRAGTYKEKRCISSQFWRFEGAAAAAAQL